MTFQIGDNVVLVNDALQLHARSTPAHLGYDEFQFEFRDTLRRLLGLTKSYEQGTGKHVGEVMEIDHHDVYVYFKSINVTVVAPVDYFSNEV